jgi:hypothetical protein
MVQVTGQPPLESVPALYSNFVGISRVGSDVQFEFIYVDLNELGALIVQAEKAGSTSIPTPIKGKTVAKIILPAQSFVQLQPHVEKMFKDIQTDIEKQQLGAQSNERKRANP